MTDAAIKKGLMPGKEKIAAIMAKRVKRGRMSARESGRRVGQRSTRPADYGQLTMDAI